MPRRPRRNHIPVFESKAMLAAPKGHKTATELAQHFGVYANQISQWKVQWVARAGVVFDGGGRAESPAVDIKARHAKIGELSPENNFGK